MNKSHRRRAINIILDEDTQWVTYPLSYPNVFDGLSNYLHCYINPTVKTQDRSILLVTISINKNLWPMDLRNGMFLPSVHTYLSSKMICVLQHKSFFFGRLKTSPPLRSRNSPSSPVPHDVTVPFGGNELKINGSQHAAGYRRPHTRHKKHPATEQKKTSNFRNLQQKHTRWL